MAANETEIRRKLRDNVAHVRQTMEAALARGGRSGQSVTLVGVTKYVDARVAGLLVEEGVRDLGESRPQELWRKAAALAGRPVGWHLIGHLQKNKVKRTIPLVRCVHSVAGLPLLEEINSAVSGPEPLRVLLEVNISGEAAKHGLPPGEVEPLFPAIHQLRGVTVVGLMAMAGLEGGVERARREFAKLREMVERLRPHCSHNISMQELSMGMSGDYEVALEEGATIVRIGSALFDGIL